MSNLKKEFYISLSETLSPDQRFTYFNIQTIEDGECLNGTIDVWFQQLGNGLKLSINDVVIPEDCIPGSAPSIANVGVGILEPGFYPVDLSLGNTIKNEGSLLVQDNRYELNLETEDGVILLHKELFRVPENTIWGYVSFDEETDADFAYDLLALLSDGRQVPEMEKGYYGYFTINNSPEFIEVTGAPDSGYLFPFILTKESDWNQVKSLAQNFVSEHPNITVRIFDDVGNSY